MAKSQEENNIPHKVQQYLCRSLSIDYYSFDVAVNALTLLKNDGVFKTLLKFGGEYRSQNSFKEAINIQKTAIEFAKNVESSNWLIASLNELGITHEEISEYKLAIECYRNALKISNEKGELLSQLKSLGNIANVHRLTKEYQKAEEIYAHVLELCRSLNDIENEIRTIRHLINVTSKQNKHELTADYYRLITDLIERLASNNQDYHLINGMSAMFDMVMMPDAFLLLSDSLPWKEPTLVNVWRFLLLESIRQSMESLVFTGNSEEAIKYVDYFEYLIAIR